MGEGTKRKAGAMRESSDFFFVFEINNLCKHAFSDSANYCKKAWGLNLQLVDKDVTNKLIYGWGISKKRHVEIIKNDFCN